MSPGQNLTLMDDTTVCFTCHLPSGSMADEWTVDGHVIEDTGPFPGSLIVTDPTSLFSVSRLKCGNKTSGENFIANVYMRGQVQKRRKS